MSLRNELIIDGEFLGLYHKLIDPIQLGILIKIY